VRKHLCRVGLIGESEAVSQVDAKGRRINSSGCLRGVNRSECLGAGHSKRTYMILTIDLWTEKQSTE